MERKVCTYCAQEGHRAHACPRRMRLPDYVLGTLIGVVLLLLSGCGTTQIVKVPVSVPCQVAEQAQPTYRFNPPYADVFDGVRDLMGDREVSLAYENALRTALKGCTK